MEPESLNAPSRRRGFGYHAAVIAVLVAAGLGALLGSVVLPQYLGVHPVFSAQPVPPAPATRPAALSQPAPAQVAPLAAAPGGTVRVVSEESVVVNVVKQVRPAVVNINTESTPKANPHVRRRGGSGQQGGDQDNQDPFQDFFDRFFGGQGGGSPFGDQGGNG